MGVTDLDIDWGQCLLSTLEVVADISASGHTGDGCPPQLGSVCECPPEGNEQDEGYVHTTGLQTILPPSRFGLPVELGNQAVLWYWRGAGGWKSVPKFMRCQK